MIRAFDAPIISNDKSLDRLLAAPIPILILFWDGKKLSETLSKEMIDQAKTKAGELIIAKINWRDNPVAAHRFSLSDPTLLVGIRDGTEIARTSNPNRSQVSQHIDYLLGKAPPPIDKKETSATSRHTNAADHTARPIPVTDATFEQQVLKSPIPVLVDFWAPWCAPCRMVAPILDQLSKEYGSRVRIVKLNVDENPHFAGRYGIQGIPTLLVFRNGTVADRIVGVAAKEHIRAKLNALL